MMKKKLIAALRLAAIGLCLVQGWAAVAQAPAELTIQHAAQAYHVGQYQRALSLYQQLAQQGNAEAAERAGFMLLQANGHYGGQVRRDVDRARMLITQAARADRVAAGFMLNMLENTD
jgi:TPR repeat protein